MGLVLINRGIHCNPDFDFDIDHFVQTRDVSE